MLGSSNTSVKNQQRLALFGQPTGGNFSDSLTELLYQQIVRDNFHRLNLFCGIRLKIDDNRALTEWNRGNNRLKWTNQRRFINQNWNNRSTGLVDRFYHRPCSSVEYLLFRKLLSMNRKIRFRLVLSAWTATGRCREISLILNFRHSATAIMFKTMFLNAGLLTIALKILVVVLISLVGVTLLILGCFLFFIIPPLYLMIGGGALPYLIYLSHFFAWVFSD